MKKLILGTMLAVLVSAAHADLEETKIWKPEEVKKGADLYARHCAACHGPRMADPEGAFDLRRFPHDEQPRFMRSVTYGKNSMPPWGSLLDAKDIESLWAYVVAGEKK